jgi:hypothetical protein
VLNSVCAATLWCIWKFRDDMIFNGQPWLSLHQILRMILNSIKRWRIIFKDPMTEKAELFCSHVSRNLTRCFELESGWRTGVVHLKRAVTLPCRIG